MPTAPGMYSAVHSILPMSSVRLLLASVRSLLRRTFDARPWRPAHARLLWFQVARRKWSSEARLSDDEHLTAAAAWLERAQDVRLDKGDNLSFASAKTATGMVERRVDHRVAAGYQGL